MRAPTTRDIPRPGATIDDWLAIPEHERYCELIGGELLQKAQPGFRHGHAQFRLASELGPYNRKPGGPPDRPGGWWLAIEVDIRFDRDLLRPDLAGCRRERLAEPPDTAFAEVPPDWVCEVLSSSTAARDRLRKKRIYHQFRVAHYWMLDPTEGTLTVHRWHEDGYLEIASAERHERIRAEPFDAVELTIAALFGDD